MTATDGTYNPDRGRMGRLIMLLGHHSLVLEPVLYALTWVSIIATTWWMEKDTPLELTVSWTGVACIVGALTTMAAQRSHNRNLCLLCITDSPLLNPQAAVEKHMKALAYFHNRSWNRLMLIVGSVPVVVLVTAPHWPQQFADSTLIKLTASAIAVAGVAAMTHHGYAARIHRKLHLWCPWCPRNNGGGDDTPVKTPTPDPAGVA